MNSLQTILLSSLSTLPSPSLSRLSAALLSLSHRRLCRLSALLSSPILFSLTLRHLRSLSLHQKSLLVSRFLRSTLFLLHQHFPQTDAIPPLPQFSPLRDFDAAILLLLLCEIHQHCRQLLDAPLSRWRVLLSDYLVSNLILRISGFGSCDAVAWCVELFGRCWNLVDLSSGGSREGKAVPTAAAAVVSLPSVVASGGEECAICREEMREGQEVCRLPCQHLFHWMCVLRWLRMRDTCPFCSHCLPSDDVRREIQRLLVDLRRFGAGVHECCSLDYFI